MNYYLPTTLKILNAYDRMRAAGVSGENIDGTMHRIETIMDTIVMAFQSSWTPSSGMRPWTSPHGNPAGPRGAGRRPAGPPLRKDLPHGRRIHSRIDPQPQLPLGGQAQAAPAQRGRHPPAARQRPQDRVPDTDLDEAKLTPAQRKAVEAFAKTIDITDSNVVLQYGAAAQKNVSEFSENTLQQIRTKDLGRLATPCPTWSASSRTSTRGGEEGPLRLLPAEEEPAGHPEGRLCQGLGQCG